MFEEQTQKLYEGFTDKLNNVFSKKPFLCTLILSVVVSGAIFVISMDYNRGEAKVDVSGAEIVDLQVASVEPKELKVDLAGAVKNPGVYKVSSGSRLSDLISLGGGFVSDVSSLWVSKNLNLSQSVSDGQKIYIPFEWDVAGLKGAGEVKALSLGIISGTTQSGKVISELAKMQVVAGNGVSGSSSSLGTSSGLVSSGSTTGSDSDGNSESSGSASAGSNGTLVNVNTATSSQLDALPGIGPAYAGRVVENRPYASLTEFKEKSGLSANLAESLKDLISF